MRRVRRMIVLLAVLALLVSAAAVVAATDITVGEGCSEWAYPADFVMDEGEDTLISDQYDVRDVYATINTSGLQYFIRYNTAAPLLINKAAYTAMYFDIDADPGTGYNIPCPLGGSIGAERRLYWNMDDDTCSIDRREGTSWIEVDTDCNGEPHGEGQETDTCVELGSDLLDLGFDGSERIAIFLRFENQSNLGDWDDIVCYHYPPRDGGEGCTPGYWKQKQHFGSWVPPYYPNGFEVSYFDDVFGVGTHVTLLKALGTGGGGANALGRHAVAALLNAAFNSRVDYLYTTADVIARVQDAYDTGDFEGTKNLFATQNEMGCPLN